ncbi:MAG: polysaccharide biosynthesis C-terminal domain-containing protein [Spirochaetia bacterium]|nr:polysaccharide biosynthesis C-terminal domain-containing protein [Spirochaetia bacterium]
MVLNLTLIPRFGMHGAAWANVLGQFPGWIFLLFVYAGFLKTGKMGGAADPA